MYTYIRQWTKDREMGWSEEANGVCHDANNWFATDKGDKKLSRYLNVN